MTNEERAKQLTSFDINLYEMHKDSANNRDEHDKDCYETALEMAEYKDQQFKEYLEKIKIDFVENSPEVMLINRIILELFEEE